VSPQDETRDPRRPWQRLAPRQERWPGGFGMLAIDICSSEDGYRRVA
jgi:hypothetical protein